MTEHLIEVTEMSRSGKGLGTVYTDDGAIPCEVPFTVPGDRIKAFQTSIKDGIAQGSLQSVVDASPLRTAPRCKYFTRCGGCSFQHIKYDAQLLHKEKIVRDCFASLLTGEVVVHPIMAPKVPWNYRNRMDYTFSYDEQGKCSLGHVEVGTKGTVINVEECHLCPQWFMEAVAGVRQWGEASKIPAYDPVNNTGVLRYLTLREGRRSGDRMVMLTISSRDDFEFGLRHIEKFVACVTSFAKPHQENNHLSIFLRIHRATEGSPSSYYDMLLSGPGIIREGLKMHVDKEKEPTLLSFEVGPSSFFQPNPQQAEIFYSRALEMAKLTTESVLYDLYCGTGTIGLCAAKYVKKVIGIEISSETASNARANVKLNACDNMVVYSGAVRHLLDHLRESGEPAANIVVVNPPRVGLDAEAMQHLIKMNPATIVYISCFPPSQAKNVAELIEQGYELAELQPVEHFPQTLHVENIALLHRREK